ncbi:protein of unknown function [Pseudodesulfovibrio profundus]|uniref:Uncharacterized protein n=1 Tax=Pseudodesulfovibrio profundus TaxID=57320 RepID=A0A2C8FC70_9BACT|nr:protein of unknown function [Pseudodesulfovibrio profundus]
MCFALRQFGNPGFLVHVGLPELLPAVYPGLEPRRKVVEIDRGREQDGSGREYRLEELPGLILMGDGAPFFVRNALCLVAEPAGNAGQDMGIAHEVNCRIAPGPSDSFL